MRVIIFLLIASISYAADADHIWVPTGSVGVIHNPTHPGSANANEMWCVRWIPSNGIQSATKIAWPKMGGTPGNGGIAIYSKDGNTRLATTGAISLSTSNVNSATGISSFNLNSGTIYIMCWCVTGTSWSYASTLTTNSLGERGSVIVILNNPANNIGIAANACTAGAPPATVGTVTFNIFRPLLAMVSKQ